MQMSAFSQQTHVPFALDFPYLPSVTPFDLPPPSTQLVGDLASTSTLFPCYYTPFDIANIIPSEATPAIAGISTITSNATATPTPESSSSLESARAVPHRDYKTTPPSSSAQPSEVVSKTWCSANKKRKESQRCSSSSSLSKDAKEATSKKMRKCRGAAKESKDNNTLQEPPTGFIHVRARRGEATDSHSLAERVRRERIKERMKMLQDLVPGCDKVVGKALLLDEIINYVQSLQNQVEFLSMKLASMNPMLYDFGMDFDDQLALPEKLENMSPGLSNVQRTNSIQPTASADTTNNYAVQNASVPFLLHGEDPSCSFLVQDSVMDFVMPTGDQRQGFLNQVEFSNMSCFQ